MIGEADEVFRNGWWWGGREVGWVEGEDCEERCEEGDVAVNGRDERCEGIG